MKGQEVKKIELFLSLDIKAVIFGTIAVRFVKIFFDIFQAESQVLHVVEVSNRRQVDRLFLKPSNLGCKPLVVIVCNLLR